MSLKILRLKQRWASACFCLSEGGVMDMKLPPLFQQTSLDLKRFGVSFTLVIEMCLLPLLRKRFGKEQFSFFALVET
ncbi:hypothetical protein TW86_10535 [Halomonas sp. S2151]|nr:hypothetical protein TW86_10535 [Halomonas sp. S2151]